MLEFTNDGLAMGTFADNNLSGVGKPGEGVMRIDGKEVARKKIEKTIPITLAWDESQDIGSDTSRGVNDADFKVPFIYNVQWQDREDHLRHQPTEVE
jgi:hypothetical protein